MPGRHGLPRHRCQEPTIDGLQPAMCRLHEPFAPKIARLYCPIRRHANNSHTDQTHDNHDEPFAKKTCRRDPHIIAHTVHKSVKSRRRSADLLAAKILKHNGPQKFPTSEQALSVLRQWGFDKNTSRKNVRPPTHRQQLHSERHARLGHAKRQQPPHNR